MTSSAGERARVAHAASMSVARGGVKSARDGDQDLLEGADSLRGGRVNGDRERIPGIRLTMLARPFSSRGKVGVRAMSLTPLADVSKVSLRRGQGKPAGG